MSYKLDEEAKKRRLYDPNPNPYDNSIMFPASKNFGVDPAHAAGDSIQIWTRSNKEKPCCEKPNKTQVKTTTMHFYVCKNCKTDLGDVK